MNNDQLSKIKYLQSIQENFHNEMREYHFKWLLSDNNEEKIILKRKENDLFEKYADTNSKIRKVLEETQF